MNEENILKYDNIFCFLYFLVTFTFCNQRHPLSCMVLLCQECKAAERINVQFFTLEAFLEAHFRDSSCGGHGFICCCSIVKSFSTLCDCMDCSMTSSSVLHDLPEFAQIHVHWVGDAIQPSHPLLLLSLPAFHLSQHQGLFQWGGSSHQVAKVLEL